MNLNNECFQQKQQQHQQKKKRKIENNRTEKILMKSIEFSTKHFALFLFGRELSKCFFFLFFFSCVVSFHRCDERHHNAFDSTERKMRRMFILSPNTEKVFVCFKMKMELSGPREANKIKKKNENNKQNTMNEKRN